MLNREEGEMEISKTRRQASGKAQKHRQDSVIQDIYIVAMVTSNGGGGNRKVAKNIAEKRVQLGNFSQVGAPSQGSEREWIEV